MVSSNDEKATQAEHNLCNCNCSCGEGKECANNKCNCSPAANSCC